MFAPTLERPGRSLVHHSSSRRQHTFCTYMFSAVNDKNESESDECRLEFDWIWRQLKYRYSPCISWTASKSNLNSTFRVTMLRMQLTAAKNLVESAFGSTVISVSNFVTFSAKRLKSSLDKPSISSPSGLRGTATWININLDDECNRTRTALDLKLLNLLHFWRIQQSLSHYYCSVRGFPLNLS